MFSTPQKEHEWLQQLLGDWTSEMECGFGMPGIDPAKSSGKETVRSLGGLWTVAEGEGTGPDGSTMKSLMTLGYDPEKGKYVGTFVASMMTHLWHYAGTIDGSGKVLVLETVGPICSENGPKGTANYRDSIEIVDQNHRIMRSHMLGDNGEWGLIMVATYHRC